jgi:hypothetical protein
MMSHIKGVLVFNRLPLKDASLGIGIDEENRSTFLRKAAGNIDCSGCFADTAFLIHQADKHHFSEKIDTRNTIIGGRIDGVTFNAKRGLLSIALIRF